MTQLSLDVESPSLNTMLRSLGLHTRPASYGCKDIMRGSEVVLENVCAGEVWEWIRAQATREQTP
jgi:hypothetical protein